MATATQEAQGTAADLAQEDRQDEGVDTGTLMGVLSGIFLVAVAIIRGGDAGVFININSALIVLGGSIATAFIAFPAKKITTLMPVLYNAFKPGIYEPEDYVDEILNFADEKEIGDSQSQGEKDALYEQALEIIRSEGKASTSFLQRKLQIGYNRAARIIDMMEADGVVSKANHVGKRDVL